MGLIRRIVYRENCASYYSLLRNIRTALGLGEGCPLGVTLKSDSQV